MTRYPRKKYVVFGSLVAVCVLLLGAACAAQEPQEGLESSQEDTHGYVAGAQEKPEAQLHLVVVDGANSLSLFDLATEEIKPLGDLSGITAITTDGRYIFAADSRNELTVLDSGAWTVDHGDHLHHYLAQPRTVGSVAGLGAGAARVASSSVLTVVQSEASGEVTLFDSAALGSGEIERVAEIKQDGASGSDNSSGMNESFEPGGEPGIGSESRGGAVSVLSSRILAGVPSATGEINGVQAYDDAGNELPGQQAECLALEGGITTRAGAVFGCENGVLFATVRTGEPVAFGFLPYPEGTSKMHRVREFHGRPGRPTVAAVAGDSGAWVINVRTRELSLIPTEQPLLQVVAADNSGGQLVALTSDGTVQVLDALTGAVLASTEPILAETMGERELAHLPNLIILEKRAYVNAPAEGVIYEIDYEDSARISRTIDNMSDPRFLVGVG
ncbi:hypothetical protein [Lysinibacter sp. HNR]|uniref:hypothetical protein n=1 Tax=Lysinibacter sp. HNR TaxID=3031408 RepID=UPI002435DCC0|nr:hypothetical protein [Lysinibacter sp. HNR]WGD37065.1 hypothetical protein FrondiHNR_11570 [Lysinibacter sp. HNR]